MAVPDEGLTGKVAAAWSGFVPEGIPSSACR